MVPGTAASDGAPHDPPEPAAPPSDAPGPTRSAVPPAVSEATRLLCAGVYLDPRFRGQVIEELVEHAERSVAPSLGFDAVPVLLHALRARLYDLVTAVLLAVVWAGFYFACASGSGGFSGPLDHLGATWPLYYMIASTWLLIARFVRRAARRQVLRGRRGGWRRYLGSYLTWSSWWGMALYWFGAVAVLLLGANPVPILFPLLLAAATYLPRRQMLRAFLGPLHRDNFAEAPRPAPPTAPFHRRLVAAVEREQCSPMTVYQAFDPFVGFGTAVDPWAFALELKRKEPVASGTDEQLTSRQVLDMIRPQLEGLRESAPGSLDRLQQLEVDEVVFMPAGPHREGLAPHFTLASVRKLLADTVDEGGERRRLFLRIRVGAWDEQVVVTVLVRVHTQGRMLMLEVVPHVLTPVRREFHAVDTAVRASGIRREVLRTLMDAPAVGVVTVTTGLRPLGSWLKEWVSNPLGAGPGDPAALPADGPVAALRELGSEPDLHLFQEMDVRRYVKTVEDRVFNGVRQALRSRGYDTGDFEQQVVNVSANGVYVGGSMFGGAIASGNGAQAQHTADRDGRRDGGGAAHNS